MLFLFEIPFLIDDGDAALLAERRIGENDAEPLARIAREAVHARLDWAGIGVDAVQIQIHDAKPSRIGDQFPALHELGSQVFLLILVERLAVLLHDRIVSRQQEAARPRRRIADGVIGAGLNAIDDGFDELSRCEVLTGSLG